jgi:hypothetical protein
MNTQDLYQWLIKHGGPVIRYRTATELIPDTAEIDIGRLRDELIRGRQVRTWLERLIPPAGIVGSRSTGAVNMSLLNELHGSKATTFENVMGKLTEFGLREGIPEFDQCTMPYRRWLETQAERSPEYIFDIFIRSLVAAFLARAGYTDEPSVSMVLKNRLDTVYNFTRQGSYDIYVSPQGYRKMPANFNGKPLINPELYKDGNVRLPTIYDTIGWSAYLPEQGTENDRIKADTIIRYIFNSEYQKLPSGYGVLLANNGRYYGMGWSVHLPGFPGGRSQYSQELVQLVDMLARFPAAVRHPWFADSLKHLEGFRTESGTYLFPRDYLQEYHLGYWVGGYRMGLEENRRANLALELESTFRMALLRKIF